MWYLVEQDVIDANPYAHVAKDEYDCVKHKKIIDPIASIREV
jgi:hypothetical protein